VPANPCQHILSDAALQRLTFEEIQAALPFRLIVRLTTKAILNRQSGRVTPPFGLAIGLEKCW
jgi:hypothetical protein